MDVKNLIKKLLLIPFGFILVFALIAVCGLRTWNDMLVPIMGSLIGEFVVLLAYFYLFKIRKDHDDNDL